MEHTVSRIEWVEQSYRLDPSTAFAMKILLLYEWDLDFRSEVESERTEGFGLGISYEMLEAFWSKPLQDTGLRRIADQKESDGGRKLYYRLKSFLYRFLSGGQEETKWMRSCTKTWNKAELEAIGEPDTRCYPDMLRLKKRMNRSKYYLLLLTGRQGSGRLQNLQCFAREQKKGVLLLDGQELVRLSGGKRLDVAGESLLKSLLENREVALYWDGEEESSKLETLLQELSEIWLEGIPFLTVITEKAIKMPAGDLQKWQCVLFEMKEPDRYEVVNLWKRYAKEYGLAQDGELEELMRRYRFTSGQIQNVLADARNLAWSRGKDDITKEELAQCCSRQVAYQFAGKATRMKSQFDWNDLILAEESKELLLDICRQSRYWNQVYGAWEFRTKFSYGMGNSLLFAGPPGTGKTMAAQVVAHELEIELFRVDLSTVVSKYIGETEKNLNLIFKEAGKSLCILFFDEADVLFGKRTEVKDAQDKYSNMEAAFLLQKMEEYDGISILATNFQQNIDEAFKRRIKYIIEFSMPTPSERKKMWEQAFPKQAPVDEQVDFSFLAEKFELTGSNIKNIAINAAFMAAADNTSIGMPQIFRSLRNEYRKSGKRLTGEELEQYYMYL